MTIFLRHMLPQENPVIDQQLWTSLIWSQYD